MALIVYCLDNLLVIETTVLMKVYCIDKNHVEDELDQIVGTTEDEFSEMITQIREYELLYGANSLLGEFGGLVAKICANRKVFNVSHKRIRWGIK